MNKEGRLNLLCFGIFLFVIVISSIYFTSAWTTSILGNYNESKGIAVNYTIINGVPVNEDVGHIYNITINHTSGIYNVSNITVSLWNNLDFSYALYAYTTGSNGTFNFSYDGETLGYNVYFNYSGINGGALIWNATNASSLIFPFNETIGNASFWFNATASTPGKYNISVRIGYNSSLAYNETNITIYINDTTKPHIVNVTGGHTFELNRSYVNVSGTIIINVSIIDNGNLTAGLAEYDVSTVNISFWNSNVTINDSFLASNVSGKYWNISVDTTTLVDGVYNITIAAADTLGNINITNISNVRVDNTLPTASVSCTPSNVNTGDVVTCTCTVSDATAGENTSATDVTVNPSTSDTGVHTETCSFADTAGNRNTASGTFTVELSASGGTTSGSGTSTTTSFTYSKTIPQTSKDFSDIETIETSSFGGGGLKAKERVKIKLSEEDHYIGIRELTETSATIELTSDPVQVKLDIGQDAKVDLNDDNFYDIHVKLNGILGGIADLTLIYLHEEIPEGAGAVSTTGEEVTTGEEEEISEGGASLTWLWILIGVVLLVIIGLVLKKKKQ